MKSKGTNRTLDSCAEPQQCWRPIFPLPETGRQKAPCPPHGAFAFIGGGSLYRPPDGSDLSYVYHVDMPSTLPRWSLRKLVSAQWPIRLKSKAFAILWVMCAHYDPQIDPARLYAHFGVNDPPLNLKPSLWPGYFGPFIRRHDFSDVGDEAVPFRELMVGSFGLIPNWSKDATIARRTYNARSETVHEKPSYRDAWRLARHCIIPAEAIYEPDWRSGKAIPTRITRADGEPLGIAGLWAAWKGPTGEITHSFTMLTINADSHPFMRQFHKQDDEKRMVVILNKEDYDAWLQAPAGESQVFLRQFPADNLRAEQPQRLLL